MADVTTKNSAKPAFGNGISRTKSLLLGSVVMLLAYGVAIAALLGFFRLTDGPADSVSADIVESADAVPSVAAVVSDIAPLSEHSRAVSDNPEADSLVPDRSAVAATAGRASTNIVTSRIDQPATQSPQQQLDAVTTETPQIVAVEASSDTAENAPATGTPAPVREDVVLEVSESQILVSSVSTNSGLSLTGRVVDAEQAPLGDLQVFVRRIDELENHVAMTATNQGGDFQFPELGKSEYIVTTAYGDTISVFEFATSGAVDLHIVSEFQKPNSPDAKGQAASPKQNLDSPAAADRSTARRYLIVGVVQSDAGQPLHNVRISYDDSSSVLTGLDGSYELEFKGDALSSTILLQYFHDDYSEEVRTVPSAFWENNDWFRQDVVLRSR